MNSLINPKQWTIYSPKFSLVQRDIESLQFRSGTARMSSIQQLFSLEGKTALVTGGTRGLGQAMAIAMAEAGADILLVQVRRPSQC
jgi:hypothetical protein